MYSFILKAGLHFRDAKVGPTENILKIKKIAIVFCWQYRDP